MGTGVVSHDTELMRSWSNTMGDNTNEYDSLVLSPIVFDQFLISSVS